MPYRERPPSPHLAPWVKCTWIFESREPPKPQRIVPDGRPELLVHFGAPYDEAMGGDRWRAQARTLFAGQLTRPLALRSTGPAGVIGMRFHPDGAQRFVPGPLRALTDSRAAVDTWWPGAGTALADALRDALDDDARIALVENFVAQRIAARAGDDPVVRACVAALEAAAEAGSVDDAMPGAIGRRQLERRFADAVGVGPARLAGILRFRRAFDLLERDGTRPWTEAAVAAGYYDQSHFIRDFRRYVGCTPSEFLREGGELAEALAAPR